MKLSCFFLLKRFLRLLCPDFLFYIPFVAFSLCAARLNARIAFSGAIAPSVFMTWCFRHVFACVGLFYIVCGSSGLTYARAPDFSRVVDEVSGSVVKIITVDRAANRPHVNSTFSVDQQQAATVPRKQSLGAGFVFSDDGYVATSYHVVEKAEQIAVHFHDGASYPATLVGFDVRSDIALLKLDTRDMLPIRFQESASLAKGEWVMAMGSPFGLDFSVSVGVVSAYGRQFETTSHDMLSLPLLQTDTAIYPGNSGGPLFNASGECIGMVTHRHAQQWGAASNVAFAIPANYVRHTLSQLKRTGEVIYPFLGIFGQPFNTDMAQALSLPPKIRGVLVSGVEVGGSAYRAGIKEGDVIVRYNNQLVGSMASLNQYVMLSTVGSKVDVTFFRGKKKRSVAFELVSKRHTFVPDVSPQPLHFRDLGVGLLPQFQFAEGLRLGACLPAGEVLGLCSLEHNMLPATPLLQHMEQRVVSGFRVATFDRISPLSLAGLHVGDVIVSWGLTVIESFQHFASLVKQSPRGEPIALRYVRDGRPVFTTIRL